MKKQIKVKEPIRLRTKKLSNGNESLYLDIYTDGKRDYEFLKLYIIQERTKEDKEALLEGLKNDIIDVISTDHAPHSRDEKNQSMEDAPFGIVGLETSVALTITELVEKGIITPMQMAEKMSYNPAQVIHSNKGTLKVGAPADVTIIDPEKEYVIDSMTFLSRGKNTPFNGWKVKGMVKATICDGKIAYMNQEAAKNFK